MSVREIVESQCPELRTRNSSDVMGASYKMPDTSAYLAKPHPFTISKSKDRDYLAPILKQKKDLPSPTQYDVTNSIIMKKNLVIYKTDRKSFCDDIAKKSKEVPGVGIYNPKTDEKIKGIFKRYINFPTKIYSSLEKYTVVDEAMYISKLKPGIYNPVKLVITKFLFIQ